MHAVRLHQEDLALPHRHVLFGKEKCQKTWDKDPIEGRTGATNPVDLNGMAKLPHVQKGKQSTGKDRLCFRQAIKVEYRFLETCTFQQHTSVGPSTAFGSQISVPSVHGTPGALITEIHTQLASVHRR